MSPALLLTVILASLLAMLPVRRLHEAGWSSGALLTSWLVYLALAVAGLEFGAGSRFILPVLVVAFVAPFVAGPERLARLVGRRLVAPRPVIDVTPKPAPGLADPDAAARKPGRGRKRPPEEYR
jgi:hypothetical protein